MQKLAHYWETEHDWRKCEARINALPNFLTEIDGLERSLHNLQPVYGALA